MKKIGTLFVMAALLVLAQPGPAMAQQSRQVVVFACEFSSENPIAGRFQAFPDPAPQLLVRTSCAQTISNVVTEFPQLRLTEVTLAQNERVQFTFAPH